MDAEFLKSIGLDDDSVIEKITAAAAENEKGLLSKRDELLGKLTKANDTLSQYSGIDVEQYRKDQERLKELAEKDMTVEERIEAAKKAAAAELQAKLEEAEGKLDQLTQAEKTRMRNESIFRAVGDKGDADLILDVIASKNLVSIIDKDGQSVLQVHNLKGDKELESVEKLIDEMKASEKYGRLFNPSGLSGGGARHSQKGGGGGQDSKLFGAARMRAARQAS